MSATVPPAANLDRPSDFGEFWHHAEVAPRPASVMPDLAEPELQVLPLTPEQQARRQRLRRAVSGIVLGLCAFTALATCVYVVRSRSSAHTDGEGTKPVASAVGQSVQPRTAAPITVTPAGEASPPTEAERALALIREPAATIANLQTWSHLAARLNLEDRKRVEHDLSRLTVTGARAAQEVARLELALLWRATARRAKAQKVLVSLARTATDPVVKKYARETLRAA